MAAPPSDQVQSMLQTAVQSVQWTYSLFWQICPQQGILVWSDGYYNGAIKTRKTVQPMEVSTEEASLQRSQQLRELYDSLSGETNQPAKRPCAALSPEDLTESEWFYLMCVSFSFPPGVGLPGQAYTKRQHVWLTGANEVDSKIFSRAILAKSAQIQTVACIPLLGGVVEFGTTDRVEEDIGFVKHVKTFFDHQNPPPPKPALSEHSTSNPTTSSVYVAPEDPPAEEEEEDVDDEEADSDSNEEMEHNIGRPMSAQNTPVAAAAVEPSELMQLEMSEDIRLGSPDDGSNNLDSDFHLLAVSQPRSPGELPRQPKNLCHAESPRQWPLQPDPSCSGVPVLPSDQPLPPLEDLSAQEDSPYCETVSTILQNHPSLWSHSSSVTYSTQSAFAKWTSISYHHHLHVSSSEATSQWLLKCILFSVPFLHTKYRDENSPKSRDGGGDGDAASRFRKGSGGGWGGGGGGGGGTPQDDLSANHVLAERRRREKLNERFIILRSLVPFVTKMDKASILGDTIEYVKQLRKRVQDLETSNRQMEVDHQRSNFGAGGDPQRPTSSSSSGTLKEGWSGLTAVDRTRVGLVGSDKRKLRIVEGSCGGAKPKMVEVSPPPLPPPPPPPSPTPMETSVQVSIIENDGLLELQCPHRDGLLFEVMQMLRELRIEITTVQSSLIDGFFVAVLRAKVKENVNGKRASIVEVKRAINQIIPHNDT